MAKVEVTRGESRSCFVGIIADAGVRPALGPSVAWPICGRLAAGVEPACGEGDCSPSPVRGVGPLAVRFTAPPGSLTGTVPVSDIRRRASSTARTLPSTSPQARRFNRRRWEPWLRRAAMRTAGFTVTREPSASTKPAPGMASDRPIPRRAIYALRPQALVAGPPRLGGDSPPAGAATRRAPGRR